MNNIPGILSSCLAVALMASAPATAQTYTITRLLQPAGTNGYGAEQMNNLGQAVGNTKVKNGRFDAAGPAFVWQNGVYLYLPALPGDPAAEGHAISDSGLVVGYSPRQLGPSLPRRAVWWRKSGSGYAVGNWNDLLPAGSPLFLRDAIAISQDGQFVVFDAKNTVSGRTLAVVAQVGAAGEIITTWSIDTIGDPAVPLRNSVPSHIHCDGTTVRVVGYYSRTEGDLASGFLWERDLLSGAVSMTDLDDNVDRYSFPQAVNGSGEVVGSIHIAGVSQAYFWNSSGEKQQLPTLGGARSFAHSINDPGYVTGWSYRSGKNAAAHAFLWHLNTGMRDLNALKSPTDTSGLELTTAYMMNNAGQILARASSKSLGSVAVLLNPQ